MRAKEEPTDIVDVEPPSTPATVAGLRARAAELHRKVEVAGRNVAYWTTEEERSLNAALAVLDDEHRQLRAFARRLLEEERSSPASRDVRLVSSGRFSAGWDLMNLLNKFEEERHE